MENAEQQQPVTEQEPQQATEQDPQVQELAEQMEDLNVSHPLEVEFISYSELLIFVNPIRTNGLFGMINAWVPVRV